MKREDSDGDERSSGEGSSEDDEESARSSRDDSDDRSGSDGAAFCATAGEGVEVQRQVQAPKVKRSDRRQDRKPRHQLGRNKRVVIVDDEEEDEEEGSGGSAEERSSDDGSDSEPELAVVSSASAALGAVKDKKAGLKRLLDTYGLPRKGKKQRVGQIKDDAPDADELDGDY
jgi:hypothetical protein